MNTLTKEQRQALTDLLNTFWDKKEEANRKARKTTNAASSAYVDAEFETWATAASLLEATIEDLSTLSL
jgi:hypothetical protein